jgi:hypothetical protein
MWRTRRRVPGRPPTTSRCSPSKEEELLLEVVLVRGTPLVVVVVVEGPITLSWGWERTQEEQEEEEWDVVFLQVDLRTSAGVCMPVCKAHTGKQRGVVQAKH